MLGAGFEPGENLKAAVVMLDQRRATFDPVTAIHVADAEIIVNHGVMDVAADHAVDLAALRLFGQSLLEGADIVHRVLDLMLRPLRERPIGKAELAADGVEIPIDQDGEVVSGVAEKREPARMLYDHVEHIAMHDEITASVGALVYGVLDHLDTAEMSAVIVAQEFVVVARQVDQARALAGLAQQLLHHVVVRLRPVPARAQLPAVDDVADQIDRLGDVIAQEVKKTVGMAAARAEMNIRYKESTEQTRAALDCHDV